MLNGSVTRRYAQALFMAAKEAGSIEMIDQALLRVSEAIVANEQAKSFFEHPYITVGDKLAVIEQLFEQSMPASLRQLLHMLYTRKRSKYVQSIYKGYHALYEEEVGRVTVRLETARDMTEGELEDVRGHLQQVLNKQVSFDVRQNPQLMAGYRMAIGNRVIDASLRQSLNQFRQRLSHTRMVKEGNR
jgi:F-type H+-transporting ATPase subunit delta